MFDNWWWLCCYTCTLFLMWHFWCIVDELISTSRSEEANILLADSKTPEETISASESLNSSSSSYKQPVTCKTTDPTVAPSGTIIIYKEREKLTWLFFGVFLLSELEFCVWVIEFCYKGQHVLLIQNSNSNRITTSESSMWKPESVSKFCPNIYLFVLNMNKCLWYCMV